MVLLEQLAAQDCKPREMEQVLEAVQHKTRRAREAQMEVGPKESLVLVVLHRMGIDYKEAEVLTVEQVVCPG